MSTNLLELDPQGLDAVLARADAPPLLLDLWAPWCAPCRAQAPVLQRLADDTVGGLQVAKLDVEQHKEMSDRLALRGIPTLILFKNGREVSRRSGVQGREQLRQWLMQEGVDLGLATDELSGERAPVPFGGAFYGDAQLRQFLVDRLLRAAAERRVDFSRFPVWSEDRGTISAALVGNADKDVFERVTGLPSGFGLWLEFVGLMDADDVRQVVDLLPAGADVRQVPATLVRRWLSDPEWGWPELLGHECDALRTRWLGACDQLVTGDASGVDWAAMREDAKRLASVDPLQRVTYHFLRMLMKLMPMPASHEADAWGSALLLYGTYVVIVKTQYEQGWRAQDFAVEQILLNWFKSHCPNPREKSREQMDALDARFRAEHAEILAEHEPKKQRFLEGYAENMAPWHRRLRRHLLNAMREGNCNLTPICTLVTNGSKRREHPDH